jgi:anti-sigma regulatory factor (Ser/Thr protein kinase)
MQRDVVEVATLLVSELVANAIRHGKGVVRLAVKRFSGRLCVEVFDEGPGRPAARTPDSTRAGGRGLLLVERLASEWGVAPSSGGGKTVWFTLRNA